MDENIESQSLWYKVTFSNKIRSGRARSWTQPRKQIGLQIINDQTETLKKFTHNVNSMNSVSKDAELGWSYLLRRIAVRIK